eukprot:CAMPEP_0172865498 /NCGR_PEP_ID=MMETSP1075-20121228/81438_1 /TAXON_ID=2916 /ORGANISM="Ceratium fusus, Strain PA161109" /LENGTH=206 /DNA_ID=CAMNT_0013714533 /DNA_START=59 /DNA_END=676 /DNA_ORIENTATION=-
MMRVSPSATSVVAVFALALPVAMVASNHSPSKCQSHECDASTDEPLLAVSMLQVNNTNQEKSGNSEKLNESVPDSMHKLAAVASESGKATGGSSMVASSAAPPTKAGAVIAPFGKEDTATELQRHAARTQDTLVDAVENAEVAEIKRSVFRALTRLRAAEIKEFDTIARLETQAIDEYNDNHHYRGENPLEYMHNDEPKVSADKYQ